MSLSKPIENALVQRAPQLPAPVAAGPTYFLPKVEPSRLMGILLRRGWIVILATLIGGGALYYVASKMPKIYQAFGSVLVNSQAPLVMDIRAVAPEQTRDLDEMRSVEQGLSATTLLMKVVKANGLDQDPDFVPAGAGEQAQLTKISNRVKVALRRGTRIIDIQVEDTHPERAKKLVESLVTEYEKWTDERQKTIIQKATDGLTHEEERLRARMESSAGKLQEFRQAHPVPGLEGSQGVSPVRDDLTSLSAQLTTAKSTRLRLESEFEAFSKFDSAKPEALAGLETSERGTEVLAQVRVLQLKEAEFGRVKERYMYKHPVYKELSNEIETLKKNLAATVHTAGEALEQRFRIATENEVKLEAAVELARGSAVDVEGIREQFRGMVRDADADRALHDSVALRLREISLSASAPASVLRWQDTPLTPEFPSSPKKLIFAAVGMFFGMLGGLALLVGLELRDDKVRDSAAAARASGAPLLATLPVIGISGDGMILLSDPASAGAEAFRRLRVVLAPPPGSNTARTVLFASAKAGEGKSFCALNYATALAMQGHRTLLLDADLRASGLSRQHVTGGFEESGLGAYLAGKMDPAQTCFATSLPNLYLLSSGPPRPDAAELLAGTRFPSLLEDAFRWFDRVVIDTPPVLAVSDMLAIARYADRTCLMVRDGCSDGREIKRTADLIRSAGGNLVGFVWNELTKADSSSSSFGLGAPVSCPAIASPQPLGVDAAPRSSDTYAITPTFA